MPVLMLIQLCDFKPLILNFFFFFYKAYMVFLNFLVPSFPVTGSGGEKMAPHHYLI